MMDQQYYLEENKMLRELAQHWEKMYKNKNEEYKKLLKLYDKAAELIALLHSNYGKIKKMFMYDGLFMLYRYVVYYDKDNNDADKEDVVYCFSQWIQGEGRKPLARLLHADEDEKEVEDAINEMIEGCQKWEEQNARAN